MVRDRFNLNDTDWTDHPTPDWAELIRLGKLRLEYALRTSDLGETGIFFGLIESMLRLSALEEKHIPT